MVVDGAESEERRRLRRQGAISGWRDTHASQSKNQLGEGDPADTPQLLNGHMKVELADLYQQNDQEDSQRAEAAQRKERRSFIGGA